MARPRPRLHLLQQLLPKCSPPRHGGAGIRKAKGRPREKLKRGKLERGNGKLHWKVGAREQAGLTYCSQRKRQSSSKVRFELVPDDLGAAHLPALVKTPQLVTDGHLVELARKHSLQLVTLDRGIPGSLFIG
jgi:hypothetical protein